MKEVTRKAEFLLMGSDSWSYHQRVDQAVKDVYQMVRTGLITSEEAIDVFNRKMGC